jgi:2,4-dienoyl-CoA reductase-like NADH-dependent reductase (Old Yellow Enzyme family)
MQKPPASGFCSTKQSYIMRLRSITEIQHKQPTSALARANVAGSYGTNSFNDVYTHHKPAPKAGSKTPAPSPPRVTKRTVQREEIEEVCPHCESVIGEKSLYCDPDGNWFHRPCLESGPIGR